MVDSDTDTSKYSDTPIAPIDPYSQQPAKKRVARMLTLDVVQDEASRHCFSAQRKFKSARTLFQAEQSPETIGRWLQGLEEEMKERQRNPQQRILGQFQQWMTPSDFTSGHGCSGPRNLLHPYTKG